MKTQRPSERTAPTPKPTAGGNGKGNGNTNGSNGSANGHSLEANGQGITQGAPAGVAAPPRTLPKRRTRPPGVTHVVEHTKVEASAPVAEKRNGTPVAAQAEPPRQEVVREPVRRIRAYLTVENILWISIFAVAIISRFWGLDDRALHHDESLHSVYSGNLYTSGNYQHDPMMHGPLQFHFIAFMYWLFDRTNATVRFASVLCGLFVVMSPFFLRKQMGRLPALICSFLLLVSPSILYFSRMAREDAIFSGMEMIMLVGLWRFLSTRKPMDFYIFCAGLSLMFTIKETTYLTVAVIGGLFILLFALQAGYAILGAVIGYLVVLGGVYEIMKKNMPKLPDIPQTSPDYETIKNFAIGFLTHPLILAAIAITLAFLLVVGALFYVQRNRARDLYDPETLEHGTNGYDAESDEAVPVRKLGHKHSGLKPNPNGILSHYEPGSLPYIIGCLFSKPITLLIVFGVFTVIFVTLYSVMFTDVPRGILSGMFASLGYWIAQQGVARGGQPWFYYFLLLPLYEPLAVFFSVVAGVFFSYKGVRWLLRNREERIENEEPHLGAFNLDRPVPFARFDALFPLFLGWWLVGALFIYSWAGEKMPWLMMHMARPAIFLASVFLGALATAMIKARRERIAAESEDYELPVAQRPRRAAGVAFSLEGAKNAARRATATPKLAYEIGNAANAVQYRSGYGRNLPPAPPPRRGGRATAVAIPVRYEQDPPWVGLNNPASVAPFAIYLILFMLLAFAWALSMSQLTHWASDGANTAADKYSSWGLTWLYPLAMIAMTVGYAIWLGVGRSLRYFAVGIFSVMLIYEFHSAIQLTYRNPDVATEMAVYVQTSPDVTRVMKELDDFSMYTTGGRNVKVIYDDTASWPMEWYLRDYPNKQFVGASKPTPGADVPVMILDYKYLNDPDLTKDYVAQRYALRWWFPEEWYKGTGAGSHDGFLPNRYVKDAQGNVVNDATGQPEEVGPLSQFGDALHTTAVTLLQPEYQATLWKYLVYKEPPKPLGSTDFVLFVRKDVAQLWHQLQNDPIPSTDIPVQQDWLQNATPSLETVP